MRMRFGVRDSVIVVVAGVARLIYADAALVCVCVRAYRVPNI